MSMTLVLVKGYQIVTNSDTQGRMISGDDSLVLSTTTKNNKKLLCQLEN